MLNFYMSYFTIARNQLEKYKLKSCKTYLFNQKNHIYWAIQNKTVNE